ncbi:MAG: NlpC/P60 family protein [Lachnospiraceae bacterium]|nr:NlpC/P60 family protein [Lachnospiraceae bacterium]
MNRKTLKFAACCLAAGMTITNTGMVALASKDAPLAGFGSASFEAETAGWEDSDVQHVAPSYQTEGEAEVSEQTENVQEAEAEEPASVQTGEAAETEASAVETSAQTEETAAETPAQTEETAAETSAPTEEPAAEESVPAEEQAETEAPVQTEAQETEPVVDTSMSGTLAFAQCDEYINIRSGASTDSDVVGKIYNDGCVTILAQVGDWYEVQSGNATGYVRADYFATGSDAEAIANEVGYNVATVHPEALMIRSEPTEDSESVGMAYNSDELEVVSYEGDWMKVALGDDQYGYINAYYVDYDTYYATGETLEEEQARLDQEWLDYLAQQEAEQRAAEEAYAAELAAQEAAAQQAAWDAQYQAQAAAEQAAAAAQQAAWDAEYQAQAAAEQQAAADAQYQAQLEAEQAAAEQQQASSDAQAQADAQYQAYLDAQAAADAATQQADEQAVYDTAAQAEAEYQAYLEAQAAADAAAQAEADAAYAAQLAAEQAAAEQAAAEQAAAEQAAAEQAAAEQAAAEQAAAEQAAAEQAAAEQAAASSGTGQSIVNFATQFVGNPYVWGGTSLTNGADCSGFTQSVFANFGISLPRTAASQSGSGTPVDLGSIQAGDLLFYEGSGGIGHVSIYMGNGQVVHASNSNTGIIISDYGYRTPVSARRYW